ncbi:DUF2220 family protein [Hymenobacter sp. M29]|uniref:DUF2220 family protein n=1 Tax=Hymenobacter mellowenesis TaxID=3063995 RepID=A0ABT9A9T3_9BACT|nr:DUF3322 and DUF2220 domain-containing protein [Hymenobacter sp. M29]MDO7846594.1 DUF2220 family protein [Hymenobacter sp. M29]
MITPEEIGAKARRHYPRLLQAWLAGTLPAQFPLVIAGNKGSLTTEPAQRTQQLQALRAGSREGRGFGYVVHWATVRSPRHGEQGVPVRIQLETLEDYLRLCGLAADFARFQAQADLIRQQLPALTGWLEQYPERLTPHTGYWPELLTVCQFFLANPRPNLYARQVPGVHSKFVEQHSGILSSLLSYLLPPEQQEPTTDFATRFGLRTDAAAVRFRLLDETLAAAFGGLADLTIPQPDFERLTLPMQPGLKVLVVENKLTFLTLPPLPATLAIWGSGYAVERLRHCHWLHHLPLWYWGDLDLHGLRILTQLRSYFPQVRSVLMDEKTYQDHECFAHAGTIPSQINFKLLTPSEEKLYLFLITRPEQNRLEQEHISDAYSVGILRAKLS